MTDMPQHMWARQHAGAQAKVEEVRRLLAASTFDGQERIWAAIYQLQQVTRTLYQLAPPEQKAAAAVVAGYDWAMVDTPASALRQGDYVETGMGVCRLVDRSIKSPGVLRLWFAPHNAVFAAVCANDDEWAAVTGSDPDDWDNTNLE